MSRKVLVIWLEYQSTSRCVKRFSYCVGFDIDPEALEIFQENINDCDVTNIDVVQQDLLALDPCQTQLLDRFDVVIMNPPFGAQMAATPGRAVSSR